MGACLADLPWHSQPQGPQCAIPTPDGQVCGACLKHSPAFDRTRAALDYAFPLDCLFPCRCMRDASASATSITPPIAREVAKRLSIPLDADSCQLPAAS